MKDQAQKGFAALEGLLILVILTIIGFTGWYVYHARSDANTNLSSAANTQVAVKTAPKKTAAKTTGQSSASPSSVSTACTYALTLGDQTGAAGTFHQDLIFTNASSKTCTLNGYPKVTLVDATSYQIGQPADNDTAATPAAVTVAAGATAHATLSLPNPGIASGCNATKSVYIYAALPGASSFLKVAAAQQWCPNFMVAPIESGI